MLWATMMSRASASSRPNSSSANACRDVARCAAALAVASSLPVSIWARPPERRFTSASNAGMPAEPRFRWKDRPTWLPTEAPQRW